MPAAVQDKPVKSNPDSQPPIKELNPKDLIKQAEKKKKDDKKKRKGGGAGKVIALLIILLLIGGAVAVVVFNAFGLRDTYLNDMLRNVPIVKNLIPEPAEVYADPLAGLTAEQLIAQMNNLQRQLDAKNAELEELTDRYNRNLIELDNLQGIEDYQQQYRQDKADFDAMIALNDPAAYKSFYEEIEPQNAAELYKQAVTITQADAELKKYVSMYSGMESDAAAQILEAAFTTNMDMVVLILKNMSSDASGAILAEMTPANAARVSRMLMPQ